MLFFHNNKGKKIIDFQQILNQGHGLSSYNRVTMEPQKRYTWQQRLN